MRSGSFCLVCQTLGETPFSITYGQPWTTRKIVERKPSSLKSASILGLRRPWKRCVKYNKVQRQVQNHLKITSDERSSSIHNTLEQTASPLPSSTKTPYPSHLNGYTQRTHSADPSDPQTPSSPSTPPARPHSFPPTSSHSADSSNHYKPLSPQSQNTTPITSPRC